MSLVVLKRKANTKYSKISSKSGYFSLNNPRRVESHANQNQTQTPMKGNVPRGHGTCCGRYPVVMNKSQYNNYDYHTREFKGSKSNPGISVKNNLGSISTRNKWMKSTYPDYVVKQMGPTTYSQYYDTINGQHASIDTNVASGICNGNQHCRKENITNIVKTTTVMDHSEYLKTKLLKKNCLPPPNTKRPIPTPMDGPYNSVRETKYGTEKGNCGK